MHRENLGNEEEVFSQQRHIPDNSVSMELSFSEYAHVRIEMKNDSPFQYASRNSGDCKVSFKFPSRPRTSLHREIAQAVLRGWKTHRRTNFDADHRARRIRVRDCERRHFARQLVHVWAHYGLRSRSGSLSFRSSLSFFFLLSRIRIFAVSLSSLLGIIRPITLCLNIYRAALGKHEPSLCMGAQHMG